MLKGETKHSRQRKLLTLSDGEIAFKGVRGSGSISGGRGNKLAIQWSHFEVQFPAASRFTHREDGMARHHSIQGHQGFIRRKAVLRTLWIVFIFLSFPAWAIELKPPSSAEVCGD